MVERGRNLDGEVSVETGYYISSLGMRKSKNIREDSLRIRRSGLAASCRMLVASDARIARSEQDNDPARDGAGSGQSARREAMFPALETKAVFHGEKEGRRFQMRLPCLL